VWVSQNPFVESNLSADMHDICPYDKFHADEDSTGHIPRDFELLDLYLLSDEVSNDKTNQNKIKNKNK
jgi:hypothetical protein